MEAQALLDKINAIGFAKINIKVFTSSWSAFT
jgi:hypothetical protein